MGMINIDLKGSFGDVVRRNPSLSPTRKFSAMENGHARAVADAIEWLSSEVLPAAIAQDHELHDQGESPEGHWGSDE